MPHYDRTSDSTEEWMFFHYYEDVLKKYISFCHFDAEELNAMAVIYFKLQRDSGCDYRQEIPSKSFANVLHNTFGMADDTLTHKILIALNQRTSTISLEIWIDAMSLFLRGTLEEKIEYCFRVYESPNKNNLKRDQMIYLMRKFVYKHQDEDVEEAVKDLVDLILKKMDIDRDGMISFNDYKETVMKDPILLECFGQCLPNRSHVYAFQITFTDKVKDF